MSRNYSSLPSGPRAGNRPPPPQSMGYNNAPPPQSMQYNAPPTQYNDPPTGSFEKRGYDRGYDRAPQPPPSGGGRGGGSFDVEASPSNPLALSNRLVVHPSDFQQGQHVICKGQYPVTVIHDNTGKLRPGYVGANAMQRQWIGLAVAGDSIPIEPLPTQPNYLQSLDLEVGFLRKSEAKEPYSADELTRNFLKAFNGIVMTVGQLIIFDFHGQTLKVIVKSLSVLELAEQQGGGRGHWEGLDPRNFGVMMDKTDITMMKGAEANGLNIKASAKKAPPNAILAPNFKFEDMGIGGLDTEFSEIFRRAFASRVFPPGLVEKLGIEHVKGLLLHGPPGTGKTLIARQIGKMLKAHEPKIVNGPEILSKFVGASEENIRKLFEDAEAEYKEKGDESELHIIIFDELDAIFKQRGSTNSGTGVGDSVVNQLLSKMDGVDALNNILIIGMTNRKDMIDEALLRPGRLEVHMEISLPDEKGRFQILNIHTTKMRKNRVMDSDVDLEELAGLTKNFSGAEINGLIKSATSFAFNRHVKVGTMAGISDDVENLRVNRSDFLHALDEVHPAFGVSEEELEAVIQNGIIRYDNIVDELLRSGGLIVEQVRTSERAPVVNVLLHGPPGSGKTALAAAIAQASQFPFIKLITPDGMVGMGESQKISAITKVFMDSYKSPLSVVVVDNIERLIDWSPMGARFSNPVLQALLVLISRRPPKGRRLLVLATTSNRPILTDLGFEDFNVVMRVPPITSLSALEYVIREVDLFPVDEDRRDAVRMLRDAGFDKKSADEPTSRLQIGIKKLLSIIEMARQEPDAVAERLTTALMELDL
ncbi:P-loop containing nucleoside triphosphate hydrolase protein [Mycena leptocephala]|nr:P-loop containing nucleoside triphosphate hydrolase protein [Mycena leptocephala]KAJ7853882.1 P-loop containing nucleoside triphosphate hydrolase protein [Mycena leptocephala]